jgi:hypothetical protein
MNMLMASIPKYDGGDSKEDKVVELEDLSGLEKLWTERKKP